MPSLRSRRKACDRCVDQKRRCDAKRPCTRCARRGLKCSLQFDYLGAAKLTSRSPIDEDNCDYFDVNDKTLDIEWDTNALNIDLDFHSSWPRFESEVFEDYRLFTNLPPIVHVQLTPLRFHNTVQRLQRCITDMAQETRTPFLKVLPKCEIETDGCPIDEALVACVAYQGRNRHNRSFLNRGLCRSFLKLVRRLSDYLSFTEHLSTIQAIVLFQIMFFLSDDDCLRQLAEAHANTVEVSVHQLRLKLVEQSDTLLNRSDTIIPMAEYNQWVLLESARRTILIHVFLKGLYGHIKNGYCDQVPYMAPLPLTIDGEFWNAQSEQEWWTLKNDKQTSISQLIKSYDDAMPTWNSRNLQNMDDFHMMLLGACQETPLSC